VSKERNLCAQTSFRPTNMVLDIVTPAHLFLLIPQSLDRI
jgi:hypothetical protein